MNPNTANSVDDYIANFTPEIQETLSLVRKKIQELVPDAEETISYGIPTYKLNGIYLVYFAGFKKHIGFYPAPVGMEAFKEEFKSYKTGKGSVQFPLDKPMPLDLIDRIVKYRKNAALKK